MVGLLAVINQSEGVGLEVVDLNVLTFSSRQVGFFALSFGRANEVQNSPFP